MTRFTSGHKLPVSSVEFTSGVNLNDLTAAFSEALGLVGEKWLNHGKRVALIALQIADDLHFSSQDLDDLRLAALLHDAAVISPEEHEKQIKLEWEGVRKHCLEAAALLEGFPYFERITGIIRRHHDTWSHLIASAADEKIAVSANLIFLSDQIDTMMSRIDDPVLNHREITNRIEELSGGVFNPKAVDIFRQKSDIEAFWLPLRPRYLDWALNRYVQTGPIDLTWDEIESASAIIAGIVDKKSPYTSDHSHGVARLCHYFATRMNLKSKTVQKLRIAGLMHDIGKLAVPNHILEKPSILTQEEFEIVKQHPYGAYYILSKLPGFDDIRDWAAFHHEKGDGSGYPFHLNGNSFHIEHLIVMFSDIIRALVQNRPYRGDLSTDHIMDILDHLTANHTDFSPLTDLVRYNYRDIEAIARGTEGGLIVQWPNKR